MRRVLLAALMVVGCSGPPKMTESPAVASRGPSDETVVSISFDPVVVRTEDKAKTSTAWVPAKYQSDGEEKLVFDRLKTSPTDQGSIEVETPSIKLGGDPKNTEAFNSMVRNLIVSTHRPVFGIADYGFAPFGLTNDLYFGHTFWDMDVWMMPSFIFLAPDAAKAAAQYRLKRSKEASLQYVEWARDKGGKFEIGGLKFPWESSVSGREVCLQATKNQQHISGDVVFGLTQAEAMGLADSAAVKKVADGVAKFYKARSTKTGRGLEIQNVTSPNEKFEGDNDLYTNLLAEWVGNGRRWSTRSAYYLPSDRISLLNYDSDPLTDYQQAAGLLAIYPLQAPAAEKQARAMVERFGDKISPSGPAMGHAVVATIWARLGEPEKAYKAWIDSWQPYLVAPNNLFSERRNVVRAYFYTGAAGAINTVLYGFIGFRIDRIPLPGAKWTKKLKSGWWLSAKPCVPKAIGSIEVRGIVIDGAKYDFSAKSDGSFSAVPT